MCLGCLKTVRRLRKWHSSELFFQHKINAISSHHHHPFCRLNISLLNVLFERTSVLETASARQSTSWGIRSGQE